MQNEPQAPNRDVWVGLGLTLLLHLVQVPLAFLTMAISLIFLSISQLFYIIRPSSVYQHKGRPGVVKGLIIGAAITFLLNVTCAGLMLGNLDFK